MARRMVKAREVQPEMRIGDKELWYVVLSDPARKKGDSSFVRYQIQWPDGAHAQREVPAESQLPVME